MNVSTVARTYNLLMTPHFVLELSACLLATVLNVSYVEVPAVFHWEDLRAVTQTY